MFRQLAPTNPLRYGYSHNAGTTVFASPISSTIMPTAKLPSLR